MTDKNQRILSVCAGLLLVCIIDVAPACISIRISNDDGFTAAVLILFLLPIALALINRPLYAFHFPGAVAYSYGLLLLNDLLLRLLAIHDGGTDGEGMGIFALCGIISFVIWTVALLVYAKVLETTSGEQEARAQIKRKRFLAILVFAILAAVLWASLLFNFGERHR